LRESSIFLFFLILVGAYLNSPHVQATPVTLPISPYVDLHSKIIKNGGSIDGVLLAVEVNSNLSKLTLVSPNGSITLLKKIGTAYVPPQRISVKKVVISELPNNATFRVFYSGFSARYVPPLNFSNGRFVLSSSLSINVSSSGFYLNVTYPRGSLAVIGRNGMNFIFKDSYIIAGNRTFNGSPIKAVLAYCVDCEAKNHVKLTGYNIDTKLNVGKYESYLGSMEWISKQIVLKKGFSFENLTLYNNCTELMEHNYFNCITSSGKDYRKGIPFLLEIGVAVLLLLVILIWGKKP